MRFDPPVPVQQFEEWMCTNWQSHIAIAPLERNQFNDCKSELKWLEYTAMGIPVVASDFGPYQRVVSSAMEGFLAEDANDWERFLEVLIQDRDHSRGLLVTYAQQLMGEYDINKRAKDWMEVFECVVSSQAAAAS